MAYRRTEYTEAEEALIRRQFTYDSETGVVTRTSRKGVNEGHLSRGYISFNIVHNDKQSPEYAHRIGWYLTHGYWPEQLDHINQIKTDNRLCNLREVSNVQNMHNKGMYAHNKSGTKGVCWTKGHQNWKAIITVNSNRILLISSKNKDICIDMRKRIESYVQAKLEENIIPTKKEVLAERDRIKAELVQ